MKQLPYKQFPCPRDLRPRPFKFELNYLGERLAVIGRDSPNPAPYVCMRVLSFGVFCLGGIYPVWILVSSAKGQILTDLWSNETIKKKSRIILVYTNRFLFQVGLIKYIYNCYNQFFLATLFKINIVRWPGGAKGNCLGENAHWLIFLSFLFQSLKHSLKRLKEVV